MRYVAILLLMLLAACSGSTGSLNLDPQVVDPYEGLDSDLVEELRAGLKLSEEGRLKEALQHYRELVAEHPDNAEVHEHLAVVLGKMKDNASAINEHQEAIRLGSDKPRYFYNFGNLYSRMNQLKDAERYYRETIRVSPSHWKAWTNLGNVLAEMKLYKDAERCLEQSAKLEPGKPAISNNLGVLYRETSRLDKAVASFNTALHHDPSYALAHYNLGMMFKERYDLDKAILHLEEYCKLAPEKSKDRKYVKIQIQKLRKMKEKGFGAPVDDDATDAVRDTPKVEL